MTAVIRSAQTADNAAIQAVHRQAFETDAEARLVSALRASGCEQISLVATRDDMIVGHILFTPVLLESRSTPRLMGMAPVAVLPEWQSQGIGSQLINAGLEDCRALGIDAVVLLGHADYYPRFGFVPSIQFGIRSEYDVPAENFMLLELKSGSLSNCEGIVRYHEAFANL